MLATAIGPAADLGCGPPPSDRLEYTYGHAVSFNGYRWPPDRLAALLNRAEPVTDARPVREPAGFENTAPAYLMVRKPEQP